MVYTVMTYRKDLQVQLEKGKAIYYARIFPKTGTFDVLDLTIRTVADTWFVGIEKKYKQAFIFNYSDIDNVVFLDRKDALKKVLEAEKEAPETTGEIMYEEY